MTVYYRFKSAKDFDSVSIDGFFINVGNLKVKIFEAKQLGRGTDYDLILINSQTNEEYLDEATLIPKNTYLLVRRVPGLPCLPIIATAPTTHQNEEVVENRHEIVQPSKNSFLGSDQSVINFADFDDFGNDVYEVVPVLSSNPVQDVPPPSKADEDVKIRALVYTSALDWKQTFDRLGPGRGFGYGIGGRGFQLKKPPDGYVCHRCKTPGHFIQHCRTNGDPNYDIKRVKPPTGIPKSMLTETPDGSYALQTGTLVFLKQNVAAFEKEVEGMPTARNVGHLPPELHCPLCKQVMKDTVFTGKCCFRSFCDNCIRDQIISKATCVCGATNILADDLLPNKTVRDTISRMLECKSCDASKSDTDSAVHVQASKGEQALSQNAVPTKTRGGAEHDEPMMSP